MNELSFKPEQYGREAVPTKMVARANKRSLNKTNARWTSEQIAELIRWWPDVTRCAARTERSVYACKQKAQSLGIRKKNNRWTTAEKIWLRHNWTTCPRKRLFERFPGRTYDDIAFKARSMGLDVRGIPPPVTCGHPVVDAVRFRAYELGFTMARLDEIAGTKKYWQSHAALTCDKRTVTEPMLKTVKTLGGYFAVCWVENDENAQL